MGPRSPSPRPSPWLAIPLAPHPSTLACQPPGGKPLPRSTLRGPSLGSWCRNTGDSGSLSPSARLTLPPGHHPGHRGATAHLEQENGQGPPSPWRPSKAPLPKPLGPCCPSPAPSPRHVNRSPHSHGLRPVGLMGANPKPRLAPKVPFPRGLVPQRWGLRTPEHQGQTYPAARPPPGPIGAPLLIQGGRMGKDL